MLPNELLLQVLHFADYRTLVLAKLVEGRFLRIVTKFAAELACRRSFRVTFNTTNIRCDDVTVGAGRNIRYGYQASAAACRELAEVIGPHAIVILTFYGDSLNVPAIDIFFDAAPPLKYAEDVNLYSPGGPTTGGNCEAIMRNVAGVKRLWLDFGAFREVDWTFLRHEFARELRRVKLVGLSAPTTNTHRSAVELIRYFVTLPHLQSGEAVEIDLAGTYFSRSFGLWVIEMLKGSRRDVTIRMRTLREGCGIVLYESDYTVDVDGTSKRYVSKKSGIVVEVNGSKLTIQSNGALKRNQRSREIFTKCCRIT